MRRAVDLREEGGKRSLLEAQEAQKALKSSSEKPGKPAWLIWAQVYWRVRKSRPWCGQEPRMALGTTRTRYTAATTAGSWSRSGAGQVYQGRVQGRVVPGPGTTRIARKVTESPESPEYAKVRRVTILARFQASREASGPDSGFPRGFPRA